MTALELIKVDAFVNFDKSPFFFIKEKNKHRFHSVVFPFSYGFLPLKQYIGESKVCPLVFGHSKHAMNLNSVYHPFRHLLYITGATKYSWVSSRLIFKNIFKARLTQWLSD